MNSNNIYDNDEIMDVMEEDEFIYEDYIDDINHNNNNAFTQNAVIILDYDDTILPSSWLNTRGLSLASNNTDVYKFNHKFANIEKAASALLTKCLSISKNIHIISIGDSQNEREASLALANDDCNKLIKSIKFVERPAINVLIRQQELLSCCLDYLCKYQGHLDLDLKKILVN